MSNIKEGVLVILKTRTKTLTTASPIMVVSHKNSNYSSVHWVCTWFNQIGENAWEKRQDSFSDVELEILS